MRPTFFSALVIAVCSTSSGQDCTGDRYRLPIFSEVITTLAVPFGSNTAVAGGNQTLYLDVYEPAGDTEVARPVVILAFGGSFVAGTRADVAEACIAFAKRGYVAVSPDYRVGFFLPGATSTTLAVMRGAHDLKACVRYLNRSVTELNDPYRIDPEKIFIGGFSAGAISALHAGYLDEEAEWPAALAGQNAALGGVEGLSGNQEYPSDVLAILSFSGALGDTTWMQSGDLPVCSIHEIGDDVVPYYTEEVSVFGFPTGLVASGSHDVHVRAENLGLDNCLLSYPGNGHVAYVNSDPDGSLGFAIGFCADLICEGQASCGNVLASVQATESKGVFELYPNPTEGPITIRADEATDLVFLDMTGREVYRVFVAAGTTNLDLGELPNGAYAVHSIAKGLRSAKLVKVQ